MGECEGISELKESPAATRTVQEMEEQEREQIRNALYSDPLGEEDAASINEMAIENTARQAKESRRELTHAAMRPMKEKMEDFRCFMRLLGQSKHKRVVEVFVIVTVAMFTIPIIILLLGIHVVAPYFDADPGVCGGFMALGSTILIMVMYVVYALCESGMGETVQPESGNEDKKNQ